MIQQVSDGVLAKIFTETSWASSYDRSCRDSDQPNHSMTNESPLDPFDSQRGAQKSIPNLRRPDSGRRLFEPESKPIRPRQPVPMHPIYERALPSFSEQDETDAYAYEGQDPPHSPYGHRGLDPSVGERTRPFRMDKRKHNRVSPIHPYVASGDSDRETVILPRPVKTNTPPGNVGNDAGGLGVAEDQLTILSLTGPTHEDLADSESKNSLSQNKVTHKRAISDDPSVSVLIDQFENKDQNRSDVRDNKSEALSEKAPSQGETLDPNAAEFQPTRSKTGGRESTPQNQLIEIRDLSQATPLRARPGKAHPLAKSTDILQIRMTTARR